ncbi:hypothetical protein GUITHDRAFT_99347 [Guillardia theta CCMP2712]|uniref:Uncharacterized protein n=1 Tax=Guillardia theta (strain CCMP2712) TaxID=905079 RepID=L1K1G6_GUITC|nr:hypothetical protein GUITHDRAFT_99347 [Guillardia theta CCMP2712]EKX54691.1 hypothetical protein GUITHDRAFT_99347 [Guillardia theta CCMP2712]|eukprot:XP_005841671.1 hypothetical protein GUITHDRAFT_99347 [Guillardia theta CCMP2712]
MASYLNSDTSGGDRKKAAEYRLQLKYAQDDKDFHSSRLAASFDQSGDPLSALYMTKYRALNSAKKGSSLFPMLYAVGEDTNQEGGERSGGVRDEDYQAILQGANNAAAQLSFRDELKSDEQNSRGYMKKLETDFLQSQNNGPGFQSLLQLSRLRSDRPRYPSYDDTITSWADRRSSEGLSGNIPHDSSRVHSESRLEARAPFQQLSMGIGSTGEGEEDGNAKDWIVAMESDPKCKKIVEQIRHGILGALLDDSTDCLANKKKPKAMWPFGDKWEVKDQGVQEKSNLLILAARKLEKEREKLKDADNEKEEAKRDALQAVKTEGALQAQVDSLYHNEKKQRKDFANVAKMAQSTVLVEEEMIGKLVKALKDEKQSVSEMQRQNLLQQLALKRLHQSFEHGHQGQNGEWYIPWTKQLASAAQAARPYSEA